LFNGFPLINIDTGGGYYSTNLRPTIEINLNNVMIHDMFDENDPRWKEYANTSSDRSSI